VYGINNIFKKMNYFQQLRKKMKMHENHAILFFKTSIWGNGRISFFLIDFLHFFIFFFIIFILKIEYY
jgi:hypothetical protein